MTRQQMSARSQTIHDVTDTEKARVYRFSTFSGIGVSTYTLHGRDKAFSSLNYRRYFYGDDADRRSREVYEAEIARMT